MLDSLYRFYTRSGYSFGRINNTSWLSFEFDLNPENSSMDNEVTLKLATQSDIRKIECHPEASENIIKSVLKFWHLYGIHSLYLGFFNNDEEPSVLQYVLDHQYNQVYKTMPYGRMYRAHNMESVQVENIYVFKNKRKINAAMEFEKALFNMLWHKGKRFIRTHIAATNKAAMIWASRMKFVPEYWISMLSINLPLLRNMKPSFIFQPIKTQEWAIYPLKLFNQTSNENKRIDENADRVTISAK